MASDIEAQAVKVLTETPIIESKTWTGGMAPLGLGSAERAVAGLSEAGLLVTPQMRKAVEIARQVRAAKATSIEDVYRAELDLFDIVGLLADKIAAGESGGPEDARRSLHSGVVGTTSAAVSPAALTVAERKVIDAAKALAGYWEGGPPHARYTPDDPTTMLREVLARGEAFDAVRATLRAAVAELIQEEGRDA